MLTKNDNNLEIHLLAKTVIQWQKAESQSIIYDLLE